MPNDRADGIRQGARGKILATWAHRMYMNHSLLAQGAYEAIMTIVVTEEGEEFALTPDRAACRVHPPRSETRRHKTRPTGRRPDVDA
jgi:hypothetical protein